MPNRNEETSDFLRDIERNERGQFNSRAKQLDLLKTKAAGLNAENAKQAKLIDAVNKEYAKQAKFIEQLNKSHTKAMGGMKSQLTSYRGELDKLNAKLKQSESSSRAFTSTSSTGLLRMASSAAIAFGAIRRVSDFLDKSMQGAMKLGVQGVEQLESGLSDKASRARALDLANRVFSESPNLRFGIPKEAIDALSRITNETTGLGEAGVAAVTEIFNKLEPAQETALVRAINSTGLKSALAMPQFRNLATIEAIRDLEGGISIPQSDNDFLKGIVNVNQALEGFDAALQEVTATLTKDVLPVLKFVNGLSPGAKKAVGIGLVASPFLGGVLGGSLARGGISGLANLAKGVGRVGLVRGAGLGLGGLLNPWAIPAMVATDQLIKLGGDLADASIAGMVTSDQSAKLQSIAQSKLNAPNISQRDRLLAERYAISAKIAVQPHGEIVEALQRDYQKITDELRKIDAGFTPVVVQTKETMKVLNDGLKMAQQGAQGMSAELRLARMKPLQEASAEQSSITNIKRADLELARLNPFGILTTKTHVEAVSQAIGREIAALEKVMKNIDTSSHEGRMELNRLNAQILGLRAEERQNLLSLTQAFIDQAQGQSFGAGKFEKLIVDFNKNYGIALSRQMITPKLPWVTGDISPSHLLPRKPLEILNSVNRGSMNTSPVSMPFSSATSRTKGIEELKKGLNVLAQGIASLEGEFTGDRDSHLGTQGGNFLP